MLLHILVCVHKYIRINLHIYADMYANQPPWLMIHTEVDEMIREADVDGWDPSVWLLGQDEKWGLANLGFRLQPKA